MKKSVVISAVLVCWTMFPGITQAQVVISEIMYDVEGSDSKREWVEVFNAGNASVDLTEWRLFEADVDHRITETASVHVPAGAYAIIADNPTEFLKDNVGYAGLLFDSSFSLSNSGETLILRDADLVDKDTVVYTPVDGLNDAGQRTLHRPNVASAMFSVGTPTPGSGTLSADTNVADDQVDVEEDVTQKEEDTATKSTNEATSVSSVFVPPEPEIYAYAGKNMTVVVGADVILEGRASTKSGVLIDPNTVRFRWNFGDGETKDGRTVSHVWSHPGRYAVVLDIAQDIFAATHMIVVTAREADITLAVDDGDMVISNESGSNLDLSHWHLRARGLHFTIPEHTILLAGGMIRFAPKVTHLDVNDPEAVLLYPNGTVAEEVEKKESQMQSSVGGEVRPDVVVGLSMPTSPSVVRVVESTSEEALLPEEEVAEMLRGALESSRGARQVAAVSQSSSALSLDNPWTLGLVALIGTGALGAAAARVARRREWEIEEG